MEVILLERIEKLGQMGDVVTVKPGYARNLLLPAKKALRATAENKAYFESQRAQLEAANLKRREEAQAVAEKMNGLKVILVRQAGETGQLYGSVTARDLADAIKDKGFTLARQQIQLDKPIKEIGHYPIKVSLHPEVSEIVDISVARSEEDGEGIFKAVAAGLVQDVAIEEVAEEAAPAVEAAAETTEEAAEEEA